MPRTARLDPLRRFLEAMTALRDALEEADRADAFLAESKTTLAEAATQTQRVTADLAALQSRRNRLTQDVDAERETLLLPVRGELARLEEQQVALRRALAADQATFDEERGRRASILKHLEDQIQTAQREHRARLRAQQDEAETDKARLRETIEELKAREAITRGELEKTKAEYQSVLDAASRLVRRA